MRLRRLLPPSVRLTVRAGMVTAQHARAQALRRYAGVRTDLGAAAPAVALTFDDGPDPVHTPRLLDLLAAEQVQATFFLVGEQVHRHPDLVRRMLRDGHAVGSHSMTHPDARSATAFELTRDYGAGRAALEAVLGRAETLFRPPNGTLDVKSARVLRSLGLHGWLWSLDPRDWEPGATADDIVATCSGLASGDIVLLHDGLARPVTPPARDRSATVAAVPRLIALARGRGLRLATLSSASVRA